MYHSENPQGPWKRIHINHVGSFINKMFLIIVDALSKSMDVHLMTTPTSETGMKELEMTFATPGWPITVVSDYGTFFTSKRI